MDKVTGFPRGSAFVQFSKAESAQAAMKLVCRTTLILHSLMLLFDCAQSDEAQKAMDAAFEKTLAKRKDKKAELMSHVTATEGIGDSGVRMNGRRLILQPAVSPGEASQLQKEQLEKYAKQKDKRNLYLLREGGTLALSFSAS